MSNEIAKTTPPPEPSAKVARAILGFVTHIPTSNIHRSKTPSDAARSKASKAAAAAALAAGTLALPPGPAGWLTILPEMVVVWRIQAQMVVDIAALYGKKATLNQEQMVYCLFRHTAAQAVRDLVVRVGERALVKHASLRLMQSIAERVGVKVSHRAIGKGLSRWLPVIGAVGVGAYAYYDTAQVAATAIELFKNEIELEAPAGDG